MTVLLTVNQLVDSRINLTSNTPITFTVKAGEVLYIVGANGSGKSTLLNLIAGILPTQNGVINAQPFFYCGHKTGLKPSLSIQDNINFRCAIYGKTTTEQTEVLSLFQLEKLKNRLLGSLSQGQQRQVALVSGVLSKRQLWILDEPFSNLDKQAQYIFKEQLNRHLQKGGAAIIAAHDFLKEEMSSYFELK